MQHARRSAARPRRRPVAENFGGEVSFRTSLSLHITRSPRRRGRATSDERCESLKINMFRMPCGLVAAWAAQHERFEGGHPAVWTRYVVVGDLDRGEVAAL